MTVDLNLPAFGMDCREWLVATEAEGLVAEELDGAPVVAVLSTAVVIGSELVSARAVLSLALLDGDDDPAAADDLFAADFAAAEFADAGFADAGFADGGFADAGFADGGFADGGFADGGFADVGFADVGFADAGFADTNSAAADFAADVVREAAGTQGTGTPGICVLDAQWSDGYARFAVPAPGGELAVVAEFSAAPDPSPELISRFYDLVTSFRWAA